MLAMKSASCRRSYEGKFKFVGAEDGHIFCKYRDTPRSVNSVLEVGPYKVQCS